MVFVFIVVGIDSTIVKSRRSPMLLRLDRICIPMRHVLTYNGQCVFKCVVVMHCENQ